MAVKIENNTKDCLPCRLVTGFGIIGIGAYIFSKSKNRSKLEKGTMRVLATATVGLGLARLMNLDFFKAKKEY